MTMFSSLQRNRQTNEANTPSTSRPQKTANKTNSTPKNAVWNYLATSNTPDISRVKHSTVQPKLKIGEPNDKYEQEADRVADQVMRMPDPTEDEALNIQRKINPISIQKKCAACENELQRQLTEDEEPQTVQMKGDSSSNKSAAQVPDKTANKIQSLRGKGKPLSAETRSFFEPRFGQDFGQVRVHTNQSAVNSANSINAKAYTLDNNIVFGNNQYNPRSSACRRLIAHELTHVIQQGSVNENRIRHGYDIKNILNSTSNYFPVRHVQRQEKTSKSKREEMIEMLKDRLANKQWRGVALTLNGFSLGDIKLMTNTKMTIHQMKQTRPAVEQLLIKGWPRTQPILDALDFSALTKGAKLRPQSNTIWSTYQSISYDVYNKNVPGVWKFIGGSIGKDFDGENSCAARISYSMNYGGSDINNSDPGWIYKNNPAVSYEGKDGDNKKYILSAWYMMKYLKLKWGKWDKFIRKNAEAVDVRDSLKTNQIAVFAGAHHVGIIKQGYNEPYVYHDPGVMPVAVWVLKK